MMATAFKNDKVLRIIIFLLFIVLLIGSLIYYQERMLFCDAAHIFFEIANTGKLQIQENRYGSFITQLFPLIATKAHIPVKEALMIYSISFNLFYLSVAALILFRFKNTKLGILFALYLTLFVSDTYFWTNNEIHQAMGWMFLLFAIVQDFKPQQQHKAIHFTIVMMLAALCLFTHPLTLFAFPFLWLFTMLEKELNPYTKQQTLFLSIGFILILAFKYYTMTHGGYDTNKVHNVTKISFLDIWNAFSSNMAKIISDKVIKDYFFIPVLLLLGVAAAVYRKKYKQLVLVLFFATGYFVAICLTYGEFVAFYSESEWMPFSVIISALFVYYFAPEIPVKVLAVSLVLIFAVRLNFILLAAKNFEARNTWTYSILDKMKQQGINKGYVYMSDSLSKVLLINWGGPVESILVSSMTGEKPTRTFFVDYGDVIGGRLVKTKTDMMGCFRAYRYDELNPNYFTLDTVQDYQLVHTEH